MDDCGVSALRRLIQDLDDAVLGTHEQLGDATVLVDRSRLLEVLAHLRDDSHLDFDMLTDLCAVDWLPTTPRFEVVYHLLSVTHHHRLRVKVEIPEDDPVVDSAVPLYASANWMEREVWDLYGIGFTGHPDPRRLLLYESFDGHPLRKDYPKQRRQPLVGPEH